jgi:hypothetical protein
MTQMLQMGFQHLAELGFVFNDQYAQATHRIPSSRGIKMGERARA